MSDENLENDEDQEFSHGQEIEQDPLYKMSYPKEDETKDKPDKDE